MKIPEARKIGIYMSNFHQKFLSGKVKIPKQQATGITRTMEVQTALFRNEENGKWRHSFERHSFRFLNMSHVRFVGISTRGISPVLLKLIGGIVLCVSVRAAVIW